MAARLTPARAGADVPSTPSDCPRVSEAAEDGSRHGDGGSGGKVQGAAGARLRSARGSRQDQLELLHRA